MKIKKEEGIQSIRQKYTAEFKTQVLERADCDCVSKTALGFRHCGVNAIFVGRNRPIKIYRKQK